MASATTRADRAPQGWRLPGAVRPPTVQRAGAVIAGALVAALAHLVALGLGAEMSVPAFEGDGTQQLATLGVAASAAVAGLLGWAAAWVAARVSGRPRRTWLILALTALAVSFVPVVAIEAATLTKLVLGVQHLLVAAVVVPVVARTLPQRA